MAPATCTKNKTKHPAVPVMTPAAQQKAGIKAAPPPKPENVTKDQTIQELKVCIAVLENPDEEMFSKEPLVCSSNPPHTCYVLTQNQFTKGSSCQSHSTLRLPTCCERLPALSNPCWTLPVGCSLVHRGRIKSTINLYPAKGKVMAMSAATTDLEWPD